MFALLLVAGGAFAEPPFQTGPTPSADYDIPGGHFFTQTRGAAQDGFGFAIVDDSTGDFWAGWKRLGGLEALGYPISHRYRWNGAVSQAFQKGVLSAASTASVLRANLLDEMSRAGNDGTLANSYLIPVPFDWRGDRLRSFSESVGAHEAVLLMNLPTRSLYYGAQGAIDRWGLPMAAADYADVYTVRTQKAVIQQWRKRTAWAEPGQILVANIGEIARDLSMIPAGSALAAPPYSTVQVAEITTGTGSPPIDQAVPLATLAAPTPTPVPVQPAPVQPSLPSAPVFPGLPGALPSIPAGPGIPGLAAPTFFPTVPSGLGASPPLSSTPTPNGSVTPTATAGPGTPTATFTSTPTFSRTPTATAVGQQTATFTPTPTRSPTPTSTGTVKTPTPYGSPR